MPRMTKAQKLRSLRSVIAAWRGPKAVTLYALSRSTGLSVRQCESLCRDHHLDVRRNAKETREALADRYCDTIESFRQWCQDRSQNLRLSMVAALEEFMRRRTRMD